MPSSKFEGLFPGVRVRQGRDPKGPIHVYNAGFCMGSAASEEVVDETWSDHVTSVIIQRPGDLPWWCRLLLGWMPLWYLNWRATRLTLKALKVLDPQRNRKVYIEGFSIGAVHALAIAAKLGSRVRMLILSCPVPEQRAAIGLNPEYYKHGALYGLPYVMLGLLFPFVGVLPSPKTTRGLSGHPDAQESVTRFCKTQIIPDSAIAYIQASMGWWNGQKARERVHRCTRVVIVGAPADRSVPFYCLDKQASAHGDKLVQLPDETPHCFWLTPDPLRQEVVRVYRDEVVYRSLLS